MKLYAPKYYQRFQCIADRCEHSCCVGWEIDVDSEALEKYKNLAHPYAATILESIVREDTPHFRLDANERCPHLDEQGLCNIIRNVGEDYLCAICREHPRFYNFTDTAEVGLGMSCVEAARVILDADDYATFLAVGEVDAEADSISFDGRAQRAAVYAALQGADYADALATLYRDYRIEAGQDGQYLEALDALEYLDTAHKALFLQYTSAYRPMGKDAYLERFFAYLVYRHCTEAFDAYDFCVRLSFCLFCERLLASLVYAQKAESLEEIAELASMISEEIEYSDDNTQALMSLA